MGARPDLIGHTLFGQGPHRAIVLHGWLGDRRDFDAVLTALDVDQVSLAMMDYRGYGSSRALGGRFDIATIAGDVLMLADHLGWGGFSVIGHSMGGKAALRVAADAPTRVHGILAITPVWAGQVPLDAATVASFRGASQDVKLRASIIANTTAGRWPSAWSRYVAERSFESSRQEAVASYFESWARDDFAAEAARLATAVTVAIGANDRGVPRELVMQTWLKELANASLIVMPECGHYPMLECPPALGGVIQSFFAGASLNESAQ